MRRLCFLLLLALVFPVWGGEQGASEKEVLWRFEFDNDFFGGSDDFFTAGWSIQRHGPAVASWDELKLSKPSRWIAGFVPGISGGEGLSVRRGMAFGQIMQTPADLSQTALIEDDLPYAGVLGVANSWAALNDDRLNVFQVYLGMLGPASFAEEVQTFIHVDLDMGEDPMGWDNQLSNELLVNLNYAMARKIVSVGEKRTGFAADLSYGGSLGLGNLYTYGQVGLQTRFGWRLSEGFAHIPDVAGRGVVVEPMLGGPPPGKTQFYFSTVVRSALVGYTVLLDGNTFEDSHSVDYDPGIVQLVVGTHFMRGAFGAHFTLFLSSNPVKELESSTPSWGNISVDYRF